MKKVSVAVFPFEPFINPCALISGLQPTKDCPLPGLYAEILNAILRYANVKYELITFENSDGGYLGYILNGSIDTTALAMIGTEHRQNNFDFGFPIAKVSPVFLTRRTTPNPFQTILLVFNVFGPLVWACLLLFVFVMVFAILTLRAGARRPNSSVYSPGYFGKGLKYMARSKSSSKILVAFLGLTSMLFVGLYRGALLTQLLHPVHIKAFSDSLEMMELIKNGKQKIVVESHSHWYLEVMRESNDTYFIQLREAIKENPVIIEPDFNLLLQMIQKGNYIYPLAEDFAQYLTSTRCELDYIAGHDLPSYWLGYIFRIGSTLTELDLAVLMTDGVRMEISRRYFKESVKCKMKKDTEKTSGGEPLTFLALCGAFMLLISGCAMAGVCFVAESIVCWEVILPIFVEDDETDFEDIAKSNSVTPAEAIQMAAKLATYMLELRRKSSLKEQHRLETLERVLHETNENSPKNSPTPMAKYLAYS